MKRKRKANALRRLAAHLESFYPEIRESFICPTCLGQFPLSKSNLISEAHIVPKAAGGRLRTYLCRDCNSAFGAKQDKWLGEYAYLVKTKKDALETRIQAKHFEIDGTRFGGRFLADRDKGLQFFIDIDRSSPEALKKIDQLKRGFIESKITVPIPLKQHRELIPVGFLTAAYLLWFHEFGYSWAFQQHLDEVRRQIRNPEEEIIKERYAVGCDELYFDKPWVGVVRHQGEIVLVAALADSLVCLPAVDRPEQPFADLSKPAGNFSVNFRRLEFFRDHRFAGPLGVGFEDRFLILPDVFYKSQNKTAIVYYPDWTSDPVMMGRTSEEQFRKQKELPDARRVRPKYQLHIPRNETGRE